MFFSKVAPRPLRVLACYYLLAAKLGKSTLDTKEGYKTKTVSTSSVNTSPNHDSILGGGGGGNINHVAE